MSLVISSDNVVRRTKCNLCDALVHSCPSTTIGVAVLGHDVRAQFGWRTSLALVSLMTHRCASASVSKKMCDARQGINTLHLVADDDLVGMHNVRNVCDVGEVRNICVGIRFTSNSNGVLVVVTVVVVTIAVAIVAGGGDGGDEDEDDDVEQTGSL